ncbi:hypothetical protein LCGC14_0686060 [marine sediment metagenome]|uniref:Uncharacterized protein n=1 Tax=marine sediment metagenome TaxID=412755 RepID=A0A0F9TUU3_9ZZZZ
MPIATKTKLKPYVELVKKKALLEQQLAETKARLAKLEPEIVEQFQENGVQRMSCDGYTIHLIRKIWAAAVNGDKKAMYTALSALDDETWSFLVEDNVNANRLAARVRECEDDDDGMPILPAELVDVIKVSEVFKIGAQKG